MFKALQRCDWPHRRLCWPHFVRHLHGSIHRMCRNCCQYYPPMLLSKCSNIDVRQLLLNDDPMQATRIWFDRVFVCRRRGRVFFCFYWLSEYKNLYSKIKINIIIIILRRPEFIGFVSIHWIGILRSNIFISRIKIKVRLWFNGSHMQSINSQRNWIIERGWTLTCLSTDANFVNIFAYSCFCFAL